MNLSNNMSNVMLYKIVRSQFRSILQNRHKGVGREHKSSRACNHGRRYGSARRNAAEAANDRLQHERQALLQIQDAEDPPSPFDQHSVR